VVVVVSEETGRVSLAHQGDFLYKNIDKEQLKKSLTEIFEKDKTKNVAQ
jgi:hypothetical protein